MAHAKRVLFSHPDTKKHITEEDILNGYEIYKNEVNIDNKKQSNKLMRVYVYLIRLLFNNNIYVLLMNSSKILFVGRYAKSPKKSPKKTARSSKSKYEDIEVLEQ